MNTVKVSLRESLDKSHEILIEKKRNEKKKPDMG